MSTITPNAASASASVFDAFVRFFKRFAVTGTPTVVSEPTWADGARFM